jgi:hypothetical protein
VIPFVGTQTTEVKFSLVGNEKIDGKDLVKIATATELTFEPADDARAELEITAQEGAGVYYFDAIQGVMINATGKQSSAMEMSGPQEITQEISETSSIRLGKSPDKAPAAATDAKPAAK